MPQQPDHLVIDALSLREVDLPQRPIIDGDAISASIAAASIVAKVTRDRICTELDARYPAYGFARNKGYGTRRHVEALLNEGPCEWHRRSFAPLRLLLAGEQLSLDLLFDDQMPTEDEIDPDDELDGRGAGRGGAVPSSRSWPKRSWPPPAEHNPPLASRTEVRHGRPAATARAPGRGGDGRLAVEPRMARARAPLAIGVWRDRPGLPGPGRGPGRRRGQAAPHVARRRSGRRRSTRGA